MLQMYIIYDTKINMYIHHAQNDSNEGYVIVELSCTILSFRRIWSLSWHDKVSNLNDYKLVSFHFWPDRLTRMDETEYSLWHYKNEIVSSLSCNVRNLLYWSYLSILVRLEKVDLETRLELKLEWNHHRYQDSCVELLRIANFCTK